MVLRTPGRRLSDGGAIPADVVPAAWEALGALHASRVRTPRAGGHAPSWRCRTVDSASPISATPSPSRRADQIATDEAQLLVTLATMVGAETAARESIALIGTARTMDLVPFLQAAAFSGDLRRDVRAAASTWTSCEPAAIKETGEEEPVLAKLRRVSLGGLIQAALLVLAASAIIVAAHRPRLRAALAEHQDASLPLALARLPVAQTPRFAQAVSTLGSVPARLPFGPVYAMQLATSFMNLALPSAAARMALSVRFFQRQGVAPATAVTSGLIDSLVGNVIQAVLLVLLLLFSPAALDAIPAGDAGLRLRRHRPQPDRADRGAGRARDPGLPRHRRACGAPSLGRAAGLVARGEGRAAAAPQRGRKLGQLVGGNLAAELLFAAALAMMAHAFGAESRSSTRCS